jgi:hypothetical protein
MYFFCTFWVNHLGAFFSWQSLHLIDTQEEGEEEEDMLQIFKRAGEKL